MIPVNLISVVIASVADMAVGFAWYSDVAFGKRWKKLTDVKMDGAGMGKTFGITFLVTLISAYVLSIFMHYAGAYGLILGAKTGLWAWLGFVMPVQLSTHLFTKKPFELFLVDSGHHLVALLVMGAVLGYWY